MKYEASLNLTEGVDEIVNANKVFSDFWRTRFAKTRTIEPVKSRVARSANTTANLSTTNPMTHGSLVNDFKHVEQAMNENDTTTAHSRLKFFPRIQNMFVSHIPIMNTTTIAPKTNVSGTTEAITSTSEKTVEIKDKKDKMLSDEDYSILDYDIGELKDASSVVKRTLVNESVIDKGIEEMKQLENRVKGLFGTEIGGEVFYIEPTNEFSNDYPLPWTEKSNTTLWNIEDLDKMSNNSYESDVKVTVDIIKDNDKNKQNVRFKVKGNLLNNSVIIKGKVNSEPNRKAKVYAIVKGSATDNSLATTKPMSYSIERSDEPDNLSTFKPLSDANTDRTTVHTHKSTKHFKVTKPLWHYIIGTRVGKRDCQAQNTYTAKDVAALEVIVDLMKNPCFIDDKNMSVLNGQRTESTTKLQSNTNSIQVHIAIPYGDNDRKRSADSLKVRRVFLAKMSTPVDLEYQVQSFEDVTEAVSLERNLSPGMYMLVETGNMSKGSFAFKPVRSNMFVTELNTIDPMNAEAATRKVETTSPKIVGRVTLSKDFITAVNSQLMELNDSRYKTTIHRIKARKTEDESKSSSRKVKRKINWESIKKWFGHDKVCSCHCKPNTTLCGACAASDAVMTELLFEFDNLAKFTNDHCTEIQTYFWMNPSGGRKLRDAVHKIDTALYNYYKRVKGKCKGKSCKTFATYMDKRAFLVKRQNNYTKEELLEDIVALADDIANATKLNLTSNLTFKEKCKDFVRSVRSCLARATSKQTYVKPRTVKGLYALDNINVNIICKPNSRTQFKDYGISSSETIRSFINDLNTDNTVSTTIDTYDDDEVKKDRRMNRLQYLLARIKKKKLVTTSSYPKEVINKILTSHHKREAKVSQIESPLIADTGGAFWYDYLNKGNRLYPNDPKTNIQTKALQPLVTTAVNIFPLSSTTKRRSTKNVYLTVTTVPERHVVQRTVQANTNKPELLSYNMNVLMKLFESMPDIAEVRNLSNLSSATTILKQDKNKHKCQKKPKKTTKHMKTHKGKTKKICTTKKISNFHKHDPKHKPDNTIAQKTNETDLELPQGFEVIEKEMESIATTELGVFKKIKTASMGIFNKIERIKFLIKSTTPIDTFRQVRTAMKLDDATTKNNTDVETQKTTATNPTIFILEDYETARFNDKSEDLGNEIDYNNETSEKNTKSLLLSILKYEKDSLDSEWKRFAADKRKSEDDMDDLSFFGLSLSTKIPQTKAKTHTLFKTKEDATGDYCIVGKIKDLPDLEQPEPPQVKEKAKKGKVTNFMDRFKVLLPDSKAKKAGQLREAKRFLRDKTKEMETREKTIAPNSILVKGFPANTATLSQIDPHQLTLQHVNQTESTKATETSKAKLKIPHDLRQTMVEIITMTEVYNSLMDTTEATTTKAPKKNREACDSTTGSNCICDIHATLNHVLSVRKILPKQQFEKYVKKLKCYKYKRTPKYFVVEPPIKRRRQFRRTFETSNDMGLVSPKNAIRWDWIRNKRSLLANYDENADINDRTVIKTDANDVNLDDRETIEKNDDSNEVLDDVKIVQKRNEDNYDVSDECYEKYFKDDDGVYRIRKKRRKRTAVDMKELVTGLRNLPPLKPQLNEIYAMAGDNVIVECLPDSRFSRYVDRDVSWKTDRGAMLKYDNVLVSGLVVSVKKVEPKNVGNYTCVKGAIVHRNVKLTVIEVPTFNVVFIPMYSSDQPCSYEDLKALQNLGPVMSQWTCSCNNNNSVAVEEPICMRDEEDGRTSVRATAVLSACARGAVRCGALCRRDLQCSLALLCASNAPALSAVPVVISKPDGNKSLTPSYKRSRKSIVTHTLRKKDLTGHREYHRLAASMYPGNVDIVVSCPKGHYLMSEQKICSVCPANTYSAEGENVCSACARGAASPPGAASCRLSVTERARRYDWLWWDWCWIPLAGVVASIIICLCMVCARVTSRSTCAPPVTVGRVESLWHWGRRAPAAGPKNCSSTIHTQSPGRPISPSRVILARLFRGSATSSRATDSQDRFEQWKQKNKPPPLPPIDFDLN